MEAAQQKALAAFGAALDQAQSADACWAALQHLTQLIVGVKLFTVTIVDNEAGLARRVYTSNPKAYSLSGTKPIHRNRWFTIIYDEKRSFVANTLADIATVFPDYELIGSLGCGSVINLPVIEAGQVVATINMLDVEQHYSPRRVALVESILAEPALRAYRAAMAMDNTR